MIPLLLWVFRYRRSVIKNKPSYCRIIVTTSMCGEVDYANITRLIFCFMRDILKSIFHIVIFCTWTCEKSNCSRKFTIINRQFLHAISIFRKFPYTNENPMPIPRLAYRRHALYIVYYAISYWRDTTKTRRKTRVRQKYFAVYICWLIPCAVNHIPDLQVIVIVEKRIRMRCSARVAIRAAKRNRSIRPIRRFSRQSQRGIRPHRKQSHVVIDRDLRFITILPNTIRRIGNISRPTLKHITVFEESILRQFLFFATLKNLNVHFITIATIAVKTDLARHSF